MEFPTAQAQPANSKNPAPFSLLSFSLQSIDQTQQILQNVAMLTNKATWPVGQFATLLLSTTQQFVFLRDFLRDFIASVCQTLGLGELSFSHHACEGHELQPPPAGGSADVTRDCAHETVAPAVRGELCEHAKSLAERFSPGLHKVTRANAQMLNLTQTRQHQRLQQLQSQQQAEAPKSLDQARQAAFDAASMQTVWKIHAANLKIRNFTEEHPCLFGFSTPSDDSGVCQDSFVPFRLEDWHNMKLKTAMPSSPLQLATPMGFALTLSSKSQGTTDSTSPSLRQNFDIN